MPSNSCPSCVVHPPPALPPTICLCFPVAVSHPPAIVTLRWARIRYRKWRHVVALESATRIGGVQFETGNAKFLTRADADTNVKMTADRANTVPKWHRVRAAYFLKSSAKLLQCSLAEAVAEARLPRPPGQTRKWAAPFHGWANKKLISYACANSIECRLLPCLLAQLWRGAKVQRSFSLAKHCITSSTCANCVLERWEFLVGSWSLEVSFPLNLCRPPEWQHVCQYSKLKWKIISNKWELRFTLECSWD